VNVFTTAHPLARAIGSLGSHGQENTRIDKTDHSHLFTDISDQCSGLADANGSVQGLPGDTHQLLRVFVDFTHRVGFVQVRVQTLGENVERAASRKTPTILTISVERNICRTRVFTAGAPSGSVSHVSTKCMVPAQMALRRTDIYDVSVAQLSLVWDSVTDYFVYRPDLNHKPTIDFADTRDTHVQTDFWNPR